MIDTKVVLFGNTLENPIIPASGTFGFGYEFSDYYDINILGSISLKGTTLEPRFGNPLPRIAECPSGMINAIGLQNPGVDAVINNELPRLSRHYNKAVIANIGGSATEDYMITAEKFNSVDSVFAIELNISCPNVKEGGMAFGTNEKTAYDLIKAVKSVSTKPVLVKLSPNVTDIVSMAVAAQDAGADGISLINTLVGMRIDLKTAKPIISVKTGGYSGPGVFPVALRMIYQVAKVVSLPIVGMGGVMSSRDVIEMMYAGASAVMVGTANLVDPFACKRIIEELPTVMKELKINKLSNIIGRSIDE